MMAKRRKAKSPCGRYFYTPAGQLDGYLVHLRSYDGPVIGRIEQSSNEWGYYYFGKWMSGAVHRGGDSSRTAASDGLERKMKDNAAQWVKIWEDEDNGAWKFLRTETYA